MNILNWIRETRPVMMLIIFILAAYCQYLNYKHVKDGRAMKGDIGHFWRLWKLGERDGKIMVYFTFAGAFLAFLIIVGIFAG